MITALALSPALDVTYRLDVVSAGTIHRPTSVLRLAGGKALNVARATATLGGTARVIAPLGGHVGMLIAELAAVDGIELEVIPVASESRTCVSAIPAVGDPTEFYEPVAAIGDDTWEALLTRLSDAPTGGWTVLSGRLPPGLPVHRLAATLLERRAGGDAIAIDGSGDELPALLRVVRPELVKINRSEAIELLGADADSSLPILASGIRSSTSGMVVLTDGGSGALALGRLGTWRAAPDPQPGDFAIGSGDSFLAGLLMALEQSDDLPRALHAASAAGSANTRTAGAGVFLRADVDEAAARIGVDPAG